MPSDMPTQGHMTHMPAHLWMRVGEYPWGTATSKATAENNARYVASCLSPLAYGHNTKMYIQNARMAGMQQEALRGSRIAALPEAGLELSPAHAHICMDCQGESPVAVTPLRDDACFSSVSAAFSVSASRPRPQVRARRSTC